MKPDRPELPEARPLDEYPKPPRSLAEPKIEPPTIEPDAYAPAKRDIRDRQIDALCNKLLSLGVGREEIAAILTATAEPYVGPSDAR